MRKKINEGAIRSQTDILLCNILDVLMDIKIILEEAQAAREKEIVVPPVKEKEKETPAPPAKEKKKEQRPKNYLQSEREKAKGKGGAKK